jgi:hypothetical protein
MKRCCRARLQLGALRLGKIRMNNGEHEAARQMFQA